MAKAVMLHPSEPDYSCNSYTHGHLHVYGATVILYTHTYRTINTDFLTISLFSNLDLAMDHYITT